MPCQEIQSWKLEGLVAAFVDLSVAFLLLCISSLVYLTSKFLSMFGSSLPCPCDGLFSDSSKNKCFQEVLANQPVKKIFAVQRSIKQRIPFGSNLYEERNCVVGDESDGQTCNTLSQRKGSGNVASEMDGSWNENFSGLVDLLNTQSLKKGCYQVKGKRCGLRYRRKGICGNTKFPQSPASVDEKVMNDMDDRDSLSVISEEGGKALRENLFCNSVRRKQPKRTKSWAGEITRNSSMSVSYDCNAQKAIRVLEQALEEEQAARAALALELEKERNAAATAADEAMAMIQRIQVEKASIEMESRQTKRMMEEKSAYDAEEMSILKEILLRREREKHFLEKEVETCRKMLLDIEVQEFSLPDSEQLGNESVVPIDDHDDDSSNPEERCHRMLLGNNGDETGMERDNAVVDFRVHDVHVIADEDSVSHKITEVDVLSDNFEESDLKLDKPRSVSDAIYSLPPLCPPRRRNMASDMRRKSMSAVDSERWKIESEVGWLWGRLRAVQQGREKLRHSIGGLMEQDKTKLQLPRDIR